MVFSKPAKLAEALAWLTAAYGHLDQAHANLKDIGLDYVGSDGLRPRLTAEDLVDHCGSLIENLKHEICDNCCGPILDHPSVPK